jgi:outer membrane cobalamin receptor
VNRTLVLLNGRRLANEAIADGYANLDVIPMSAIARVEILRDGASSIYGSDAIGGVVNFITKTSKSTACNTAQAVQPAAKAAATSSAPPSPGARAIWNATAGAYGAPSMRTSARP